ncbi:type I restriction endonuclease subunit R [Dellaglioa algida]|uniref:Type I restriction enzyme endonuclease subunit n=1 Tax=Dellaglioa algida TaxID=105612 RepID=A0A5C6MB22_9LACO|nr:type I restriction endonuclease subunit R [Dellaglioa algida]MDK1717070.1 type I restriction endonuclease subunit R [Dellaglioa algida]MDK1719860.1 type I restriction endonuclease subunit R [Dellaglioa algida]MDK1722012.1 type I restriction endonuclease subunit R [Dellaglioa algida]MDK1723203.1 type I restriction endonuclease subunit R [Dellaglioa algida]MDK1739845.1 type I restriction endonuclease subunit R [Dellaglioa algida]
MAESEAQLEERFIGYLEKLNYKRVELRSLDEMIAHFRAILNQRNADKLNGKLLTDGEFSRIMSKLTSGNAYATAHILRDQTLTIQRDDTNEPTLYLNYFDTKNANKNIYEVTNQVTVMGVNEHENRYDVTILVNGLPLVQVELKKRGVENHQAFNQIGRYRQVSYQNLFRFIQIFVISNGVNSQYMSNTDGKISADFLFNWTDEGNHRFNEIQDFTNSFLEINRLHSMISKYFIFDERKKVLMVMRPYQVYATEALVNHALTTNENGYIWHTTGSGKTVTSFKAATLLAQEESIEKVIFMLDRADLNKQTTDNFTAFSEELDLLSGTESTYDLVRQLKGQETQVVITTIQKMNYAVTRHEAGLAALKDKKVVFIVDEAHRTTFGEQQKAINGFFSKAQWFGFTGTPRFKQNPAGDGRTTDDIFTTMLHSYLITDAIRDKNVLGFQIDYMSTLKMANTVDDGEEVVGIDTQEVYESEERIAAVTKNILGQHLQRTRNGKFNAFLTVKDTKLAVAYYDEFNKQLADSKKDIKVATIFTWAANEDGNEDESTQSHSQLQMDRIIDNYNKTYHTQHSTNEFRKYAEDVQNRVEKNDPLNRIDILIVVNMLLTGFDSKTLNTLYVDKNLEYHNLIQAYSRTNRVYDMNLKPFGQIVAYRKLKEQTDEALELFGATNSVGAFLQPPFNDIKADYQKAIDELLEYVGTPQMVDDLPDEEAQSKFIKLFRTLARVERKMEGYAEFDLAKSGSEFGFTEQDMNDYRSKYLDIYIGGGSRNKASILDEIDFEIDLIEENTINTRYIKGLIGQLDLAAPEDERRKAVKELIDGIKSSNDANLFLKRDLLISFLENEVPSLSSDIKIEDALLDFFEEQEKIAVQTYSKENDVPESAINETISEYKFTGREKKESLKKGIGAPLKNKRKIESALKFAIQTVKKFTIGV